MLYLEFQLEPQTESKIKKILENYSDKEVFFKDIIQKEINDLKNGIINIEMDLKKFESKYNLTTGEFYRKFKEGELGDEEDFLIWAGIYEMQIDSKKKLSELE